MVDAQQQAQDEIAQLRDALTRRSSIEQAKGAIAVLRGCTPDMAFEELRQASMEHNVKLRDLATAIVTLLGQHRDAVPAEVRKEVAVAVEVWGRPPRGAGSPTVTG